MAEEQQRDVIAPLVLGYPVAIASILPTTTTHGQMFAIGAACTAAVLALAGGIELFGRTKRGAVVVASAVVLVFGELVGFYAFTKGLGLDSGKEREALRTAAKYVLLVRGLGWAGVTVGLALAKSALWTRQETSANHQTSDALRFVSGAMIAMLVVAAITFGLAAANIWRTSGGDDPSGVGIAVAVLTLNALGVLAYGALRVRSRGRTGMTIAASVFLFYLAVSTIQLFTLLRVISGSESYGTLGSDGRDALPEEMPIAMPMILSAAWVVLAIALHVLAASVDIDDRKARRDLSGRAAQTTIGVIACQGLVLGVISHLDNAENVSKGHATFAAFLLVIAASVSLALLVRASRSIIAEISPRTFHRPR